MIIPLLPKWDNASLWELEGSWFQFQWCCGLGFQTQPHYKAPSNPSVELENVGEEKTTDKDKKNNMFMWIGNRARLKN